VHAGDTYIRAGKHVKTDPHLWIVISDPSRDTQLVTVNVTSQRSDKDQSCVLQPGEHEFIGQESVIMYAGARVVPESVLFAALKAGVLVSMSRVSAKVLSKVRAGAIGNDDLPLMAKRMLQAQGIIPDDTAKP